MADSVETKDDMLTKLVDYYESAAEATQEARAAAERDRDYYDHKQLTEEQINELRKRKQAPTIVNFVQKKINYLLGVERQTRMDPKAYPRTPAHEDAAHAASDAIRYICENNSFDVIASKGYDNLLVEGIEAAVVEVKSKGLDDFDVLIKRVSWDRCFFDPHSREEDFEDATYRGYIQWMDLSEARDLGKRYDYKGDFSEDSAPVGESYDDKPSYQLWYDGKRKRVKISYVWYREKGKWMHAIYTKAGVIWGPKPCPYVDEDGEPECNFIVQSALVDRDNNRYGYVRSMISQQDAINKRESKSLHLLSQRQTWSRDGAFKNVNQAKLELAKPDGHVEVEGHANINEHFGILDTGDMAQGQFLLLQEAKRDLDTVTATGDIAGAATQSGRALEARAQSGNVELTIFTDAHKQWKKRVYRSVWNKVRQFWTSEKWVRVTDDEDNLKWVGLNSPVTMAEQMLAEQTGESVADVKKNYAREIQQAIAQNPQLGEVVETENQVADLDVDIIIDEAPDVINLQAEQFQTIANIAERRGDIPTSLIIKMSNLRNKDQILDELEGDDKQKEAAAQEQQEARQIQMAEMQAEIQGKQAKADRDRAEIEKTQQETLQTMLENAAMQAYPTEPDVII